MSNFVYCSPDEKQGAVRGLTDLQGAITLKGDMEQYWALLRTAALNVGTMLSPHTNALTASSLTIL